MTSPAILWFRRDLRLHDNLALGAALESGNPILPVYILDNRILSSPRTGSHRARFFVDALRALDNRLQRFKSRLLVKRGTPENVLHELIEKTGAAALFFNRDYTPFARERDKQIYGSMPVAVHTFHDLILKAPTTVMKADGDPYRMYTPFKKTWLESIPGYQPHREPTAEDFYQDDDLDYVAIPSPDELGYDEVKAVLEASGVMAWERLNTFIDIAIRDYQQQRNILLPDPVNDEPTNGTSGLSPYLRWGIISPRQCLHAARTLQSQVNNTHQEDNIQTWINELIWRDFYHHILYFFPHVRYRNFREDYDSLEWRDAPDELGAWKDGMTGYPVVDAAMRQLKSIGWMHNRARMIVASFLCKDLLIDWREGERHFMQYLIDGDTAANNGGWQWAAGTGTDAQPYFRIFNPVSQSKKHDPDGAYIRRWVPELQDVPAEFIHEPWTMDKPPGDYPAPIIDHGDARERTIAAFKKARGE